MKKNKFLIIGVLCLSSLVGCSASQETTSDKVIAVQEETPSATQTSEIADNSIPEERSIQSSEEPSPEQVVADEDVVTEQINSLAAFIGKTAHEVNLELGQPTTTKKIEDSEMIAANYYKIELLGEIVKVEMDFDVDQQTVNYISCALMYADDIEASKETFINALTALYGESTIERYMNVKGKQRRDWNDGTLMFDLKYYEDNLALDIYPMDK